jgi:hypothetical protein
MTRICRAKFERDDLNEAMIICGCHSHDIEAQTLDSKHDQKNGDVDVEHHPMEQPRTWRGPHTFPFSYATSPHAYRNAQRRPIPFENAGTLYTPVRADSPQAVEYHAESIACDDQLPKDVRVVPPSEDSLISLRPPHPRWDDETDPDHPYDNPYYTKPIGNSLWLPRNPCGQLNLDDTVNLTKALTSTENAGVLGSWLVGPWQRSPLLRRDIQTSLPPESPLESSHKPPIAMRSRFSGNEQIVLPPRMASRIHSADIEDVPRFKRLPLPRSLRRTSDTDGARNTRLGFGSYRPSYFGPSPHSASLPSRGWWKRSVSLDPRLAATGLLPDAQAQVELLLSEEPAQARTETPTVTPAEAVAQEAIVEEQAAAEDRMMREEEEAEENTKEHPWWMGWLFSRATTT